MHHEDIFEVDQIYLNKKVFAYHSFSYICCLLCCYNGMDRFRLELCLITFSRFLYLLFCSTCSLLSWEQMMIRVEGAERRLCWVRQSRCMIHLVCTFAFRPFKNS